MSGRTPPAEAVTFLTAAPSRRGSPLLAAAHGHHPHLAGPAPAHPDRTPVPPPAHPTCRAVRERRSPR